MNFLEADIQGANLRQAFLLTANLQKTILWGANLQEAVLEKANLMGAYLQDANLEMANLKGANLSKVKGLKIDQLSEVKTLYKAVLDPALERKIKKKYPQLLGKPVLEAD
jgi:uncharacterized protein YjbI with pentapeptide repeats